MMKKTILMLVGVVMFLFLGISHATTTNVTLSKLWVNQSRLYLDLKYTGNESQVMTTKVVIHYATHTKEFEGSVFFVTNTTQRIYVDLDPGYLENVEIFVDGQEIANVRVNTIVRTKDYGIFVEESTNQTTVGHPANFKVEFYYPEMTEYGYMWSYDGKNWQNETFYPKTEMVVLNASISPKRIGELRIRFFLKIDGVYMYNTKEYFVRVIPDYGNQNFISPVAVYDYQDLRVWRDYKYNPDTNYTLVATHLVYNGTSPSVDIKMVDWLPPTITVDLSKTLFDPEPEISHRSLTYMLTLEKGKEETIGYVFKGRADPKLVAELPAPAITIRGHVIPQVIKRVYHIGNITVTRTLEYNANIDKTIIVTKIVGLNESRTYIIMDTLPGVKDISKLDIIPRETNYTVQDNSLVVKFNVSSVEEFTYIYRLPGHISPAYIDALGAPAISTANIANETNNTNVIIHKNPLTGLISMLESGSITYASIILTAAIIAFLVIMSEARRPVQISEITEEEMILAEFE